MKMRGGELIGFLAFSMDGAMRGAKRSADGVTFLASSTSNSAQILPSGASL